MTIHTPHPLRDRATAARQRVVTSLVLFVTLLAVFAASPVATSFDSRWSVHTAHSFARGNGGDLTGYLPALERYNFQSIERPDGRPRAVYPIGASLLVMPLVAAAALAHPPLVEQLRNGIPANFEKVLACLVGAAAGVLLFWLVVRQFHSVWIALATTAVFAFATPMWSTATRGLWQHGPLVLMFVITMLLLQRARERPALVQYASLPLAFALVIRPTAAIPIAVFSLYVLIFHRPWFLRYVLWAQIVAMPWIAFNLAIYGMLFPPYYLSNVDVSSGLFLERLSGNLFSPSRGLFVYSPVLLLAISGFVFALRDRAQRPLAICYGAIVVGHTLVLGNTTMWWGGHCYGPRFMTDVLPFLVFLLAFNLPVLAGQAGWKKSAFAIVSVVLALVSVAMHAQGALRSGPIAWNAMPNNVDQHPERLWDWRDPPFLRTSAREWRR